MLGATRLRWKGESAPPNSKGDNSEMAVQVTASSSSLEREGKSGSRNPNCTVVCFERSAIIASTHKPIEISVAF